MLLSCFYTYSIHSPSRMVKQDAIEAWHKGNGSVKGTLVEYASTFGKEEAMPQLLGPVVRVVVVVGTTEGRAESSLCLNLRNKKK